MAHEGTAQRIGIGKAALSRDLLGGFVSLLEKAAGSVDPRLLDPGCRRDADLAAEEPGEMARAEIHPAGEACSAVIVRGIGRDPALHTTPGVPEHMHPVVALVTAGVEMDVLGLTYKQYSDAEREAVVNAFPRTPDFKEDIIQAFYDGIKHKPETTFGNVKADVIADKDPHFHRGNFCSVIRCSHWHG